MDFDNRYEKQAYIDVECPVCGEVNSFVDDKTIHEDTLVCCECNSEFHLFAEADEDEADMEVDINIPDQEEIVGNTHSFILEHCESNNHLYDILNVFYATAFSHGMKQALVLQTEHNMEAISVLNQAL